jgi:hypothetical protein
MVIPIGAVRDRTELVVPSTWREPAQPSIRQGPDPLAAARGAALGLLIGALLWVGLIAGGRALLALLH